MLAPSGLKMLPKLSRTYLARKVAREPFEIFNCIIGEITRLFCHFLSFFSKYLVLYFTHHFEKYVFYRNFEKYNAYVLLILAVNNKHELYN